MHKKFKEKLSRDILLDEMEQSTNEIRGIYRSICHLEDYCNKSSNITEINNMTHIIESIKYELYCLQNNLDGIVQRQKYDQSDAFEKLTNLNYDNVIFED